MWTVMPLNFILCMVSGKHGGHGQKDRHHHKSRHHHKKKRNHERHHDHSGDRHSSDRHTHSGPSTSHSKRSLDYDYEYETESDQSGGLPEMHMPKKRKPEETSTEYDSEPVDINTGPTCPPLHVDCQIVIKKKKHDDFSRYTVVELGKESENLTDFLRYLKKQHVEPTVFKLGLVDFSMDLSCKIQHSTCGERQYNVESPVEWTAIRPKLLSNAQNVLVCEVRQKAFVLKAAASSTVSTSRSTTIDADQANPQLQAADERPNKYKTQTRDRINLDLDLEKYLATAMENEDDVEEAFTFTFERSQEQRKLLNKMEEGW